MRGKSLLAIFLLSLATPLSLCGQIARNGLSQDLSTPRLPRPMPAVLVPERDLAPFKFPRPAPIAGGIGLSQLTNAAGIIFSGRVTSIRRALASGAEPGTVAITFHVERAISSATAGQDLTIFQWIGLWTGGQTYRVGERLILFLYPPSKLGLTSCVAGPMGRFTVDSLGRIVLSEQHLEAFRADRYLSGRLQRRSQISFRDFAQAVRRASGGE